MHRGDGFQQIINASNEQYSNRGLAVIIEVTAKASKRPDGTFYYKPKSIATSSLDYIGAANGIPITFDAKETRERSRFPLKNIKPHQVQIAENFNKHGVSFFLVNFVMLGKCYRLHMDIFTDWWNGYISKAGPASIPLEVFEKQCDLVRPERGIFIDYLKGIEKYRRHI